MHPQNVQYATGGGAPMWLLPIFGSLFILVIVWSIFWKGLGLWHSAQRGQWVWFLVMLVLNTAGILEIIYLFGVIKTGIHGLFTNRVKPTETTTRPM